ncbi:UNVERIFIED_CONTAM: hypothetical protein Sradi_5980700 [Sesamum radiatum]|uniref:Uncharacterized protein n=1 Tax=Sesamum radiatum TaxID=300843 RepID=A0AAW2KH84_SESRA
MYEDDNFLPPHQEEIPARGEREAQRGAGGRASPLGGYPNPMRRGMPVPPLAMAPPRRSPFAPTYWPRQSSQESRSQA